MHKLLLEHSHTHRLYINYGCFHATLLSWLVVTEIIWPRKPTILMTWPFTEKVCWSYTRKSHTLNSLCNLYTIGQSDTYESDPHSNCLRVKANSVSLNKLLRALSQRVFQTDFVPWKVAHVLCCRCCLNSDVGGHSIEPVFLQNSACLIWMSACVYIWIFLQKKKRRSSFKYKYTDSEYPQHWSVQVCMKSGERQGTFWPYFQRHKYDWKWRLAMYYITIFCILK